MEPPILDPQGKDQSKRATHPAQRAAYDPETQRSYLETVLGEVSEAKEGDLNTQALAPYPSLPGGARGGGKVTRQKALQKRRALLTQRILVDLASGESVIDIADKLGVTTATVTGYLARHRRDVESGEIDQRLDEIAVPLAADNLIHGLIAGDKDYTLETLKGRGKFRRHTEDAGAGKRELPVLRISIEVPNGNGTSPLATLPIPTADQMIAGGRIVGAMRLPKPNLPDIDVQPGPEADHALQIAGAPRTTT